MRDRLIRQLADGQFHTGSALAEMLGVSRSAVWKQVHGLGRLGLEVESAGRRGYRLKSKLDLLDSATILGLLDQDTRNACEGLSVETVMQSTSLFLAGEPPPAEGCWRAVLAEYQSGGRARRGRRWLSPFGAGLCVSLSWRFASAPRDLPALSLAAGIGVIRVLEKTGADGLALKWPNDILIDGAKLGGILVDVDGDARGPLRAIIGVGINLSLSRPFLAEVSASGGLPPGALNEAISAGPVARNRLAAALIESLYRAVAEFARCGFAPLADAWRRRDYLYGKALTISSGANEMCGVGAGLAADGALLVEGADGISAVLTGDVTVRAAA